MCIVNDSFRGLCLLKKFLIVRITFKVKEGRAAKDRGRLHSTTLYSVNSVVINLLSQLPFWWFMGRAESLIFPINLIVVR